MLVITEQQGLAAIWIQKQRQAGPHMQRSSPGGGSCGTNQIEESITVVILSSASLLVSISHSPSQKQPMSVMKNN